MGFDVPANELQSTLENIVITKKLTPVLAAAALGLTLASAPASAAITFFSPVTAFQDDDLDFVFDNDGDGTLSVGDRLVSVIEFVNTQGELAGQGPNAIAPEELTAIADVTIAAIDAGTGTIIFAPTNDGVGEEGVLAGFADGTAVALWTDPTPDLNVINAACGDRPTCFGLAGLGGGDGSALWATLGFFDPDAAWTSLPANGGGSIATVEAGGSGTNFGGFNYSLAFGINNTGREFGLQPCAPCSGLGDGLIQLTGSGNILGGRSLDHDDWTARSDADARVLPIPEPGTLALLGIALAGAGLLRRRT